MGGKTVSRRITHAQATLYKQWIGNRQRALQIIAEMERISVEAEDLVLEEGSAWAPEQLP